MDLGFGEAPAHFESPSQIARVLTEGWVAMRMFCPGCGADSLEAFANNRDVADFHCPACAEEYELKSQKGRFGPRVVDGAYAAMLRRMASSNNPNLLLMTYDMARLAVTNLMVVPRHFFVPAVIEARKPLALTARRAGWQGCNILLCAIPASGKIHLVRDGVLAPRDEVLGQWRRTLFLRDERPDARGWLLEVMRCVELIGAPAFTLADVYAFEPRLAALYPDNRNVRPKIRQQLQVLRDHGWLEFEGKGRYRLAAAD
jgi:type II restriction enzyme